MIADVKRRLGLALRQDSFVLANRGRISTGGALDALLFDCVLARILAEKDAPFVLQVGAHSGNTSHDMREQLIRSGAWALLVEPQPDVFECLKSNYASVTSVSFANVALSDCGGNRELYRISDYANQNHKRGGVFGSSIASFDAEHPWQYYLKNARPEGRRVSRTRILESVMVRCVSFDELVTENQIKRIDVLVIDTEGFDFEVLKMVDAAGFSPHLIKYEHKHLPGGLAEIRDSWQFLIDRGYHLVAVQATGDTVAARIP